MSANALSVISIFGVGGFSPMSRRARTIDRQAIEILLSGLEAPSPVISAAALQCLPSAIGEQLISVGVLKPDGHEALVASLADHDDVPVSLTWSERYRAYGYFSPAAGWVTVPHQETVRYRIDIATLILMLAAKWRSGIRAAPAPLVDGHLWEIGEFRFGKSASTVRVLFGRRMSAAEIWRRTERALEDRQAGQRQVLLTSTQANAVQACPVALTLSLHELLLPGHSFAVDPEVIASRLMHPHSAKPEEPLVIIAGGREVHFQGRVFKFHRGFRQREIIRLLEERYRHGELRVSTAEAADRLDLREGARIRDYFHKSPAWNVLLTERDGMCGFCWEIPGVAAKR